jgi:glycogen(starch) synthase
MRILVVSNLYPPYYVGGYELGCKDVVEGLKTRGHDVRVLTSTYKVNKVQMEEGVYRWLQACFDRTSDRVLYKELVNQTAFKQLCGDFSPHIVFLWNITHISISLASLAEEMGLPTCYYVFDNWLATWEMDQWYQIWHKGKRGLNQVLRFLARLFNLIEPPRSLDLTRVIFASRYLRDVAMQVGKPVDEARVIPFGVDIYRFPYRKTNCQRHNRLLYIGQIQPHKGIHIAIQALGILRREQGNDSITLTIVGDMESSKEYVSYLWNLAEINDVKENISFIGRVSRENLLDIYHGHDIIVFPFIWDEPFGIALLEAMSCGLAIVCTATGGGAEIVENGFNTLTFSKKEPQFCAQQIQRLLKDPDLFESIRKNARKTVEQRFRIEQTVDSIERMLIENAI